MKGETRGGTATEPRIGAQDRPFTRAFVLFENMIAHPQNARRHISEKGIEELAASIRQVGILDDLLLRPQPGDPTKFQVLGGHRRRLAGPLAGKAGSDSKIYDVDDKTALEIMFAANLERENLTPWEEREAIVGLESVGWPLEAIAQHLGKSPAWAYKRVSLRNLSKTWKHWLNQDTGQIHAFPAATLEAVARLHVDSQERIADKLAAEIKAGAIFTGSRINSEAAEFSHELRLAPWDPNDATLDPRAGACTACDKRTSCRRVLFDELKIEKAEEGKIPKGDQCLDASCYETKLRNYRRGRIQELKKEHGTVKVFASGYDDRKASEKLRADLVDQWNTQPAPQGHPHAFAVYDVANDKLGFRVENKHAPRHSSRTTLKATSVPKSLKTRRKELDERRTAYVVKALAGWFDETDLSESLDHVTKCCKGDHGHLIRAALAIAACSGVEPFAFAKWPNVNKNLKTDAAAIASAWEGLVHAIESELVGQFGNLKASELAKRNEIVLAIESAFGLRKLIDGFRAKAEEEIPIPKSWAHLKADGTPRAPKGKKAAKPAGKRKAKKLEEGDVCLEDGRVADAGA